MQFIALGMHGGTVYILDHQGNNIRSKELELVSGQARPKLAACRA